MSRHACCSECTASSKLRDAVHAEVYFFPSIVPFGLPRQVIVPYHTLTDCTVAVAKLYIIKVGKWGARQDRHRSGTCKAVMADVCTASCTTLSAMFRYMLHCRGCDVCIVVAVYGCHMIC